MLLIAAAIAIGYRAVTTTRYFVHNYQLRGQEAQLRVELRQLDQDRAQLTAVRDYLNSEAYVEQVARTTLGLVRPGDTLVIVTPADTVPPPTPGPAGETTPGEPWWKELFVPPTPRPTPRP
ncbi:MAG: septum formation initiator family protein [Dehalococcoidia bacterium]|nr:septum formation initiator family protein [Dehalococcoidia bacterium]